MNALRNSFRMLLGRRPAALQVAAICRNAAGEVGWVLASFLVPVE